MIGARRIIELLNGQTSSNDDVVGVLDRLSEEQLNALERAGHTMVELARNEREERRFPAPRPSSKLSITELDLVIDNTGGY